MRAYVGDRLVVVGHRVGDHGREAEILEVRGADGAPPYLVRWTADDQQALVFPGSDASIEHRPGHEVHPD
jgi:uncharacterized protein DUF1918